MNFFKRNPILKITCEEQEIVDFIRPVTLVHPQKTLFKIRSNVFRVIRAEDKGEAIYIIDNLQGKQQFLSLDQPVAIKNEGRTFKFQLAQDFIVSDNKLFKNFLIYSCLFHLFIAGFSAVLEHFAPKKADKTEITINSKRINDLLAKMKKKDVKKSKKEPKKIAKKDPKPKPKPKLKPKPAAKKVAKKIKKKKPTPRKKIAKKRGIPRPKKIVKKIKKRRPPPGRRHGPSKRLVAKRGRPKRGGARKTPRTTSGRGRKAKSPLASTAARKRRKVARAKARLSDSLSFLSGGSSKFKVKTSAQNRPQARYAKNGASGRSKSKSKKSYLNKLVANTGSGSRGSGPIQTTGARGIATGKAVSAGEIYGSSKGKSLNGVQGKVQLSRLYDYGAEGNIGGALGGGGNGLKMSGKGKLSQSLVEKTLAKHIQKLQYCYEKALLSDSSLSGNVWIKWIIKNGGRVSGVKVTKSELNNKKLHTCLRKKIANIRFPSPKGGAVSIKYPFNFSSSSL